MLNNATRIARLRGVTGSSAVCKRAFGRSTPSLSHQVNAAIELDPNTQALLNDMALRQKPGPTPIHRRELTAFAVEPEEGEAIVDLTEFEVQPVARMERKSPAALFGSQQFGQVVIPKELQEAVTAIIDELDNKTVLRSDAHRLFSEVDEDGQQIGWQVELDTKYRSKKQGDRHAARDGIAFAAAVMPAHYSAIYSVFRHLRHRMGPSWEVDRVLDWGSGSGSGLWASLFSFQPPHGSHRPDMLDIESAKSTVRSYIGIDKRHGLVTTAKKILDGIPTSDNLSVKFRNTLSEADKLSREQGTKTVALSAFILSSLPTPLARKALVKEMWESGAETLVLIDQSTKEGFEVIGQAREYLLRIGQKEVAAFEGKVSKQSGEKTSEDLQETAESSERGIEKAATPKDGLSSTIRGSYVVAPCPHDRECPLLSDQKSRLVCGFSQRLQRPSFVRLTKRSGVGHEDIGYSYVVIRRGCRPERINSQEGRVGLIGRRAEEEKGGRILQELELFKEGLEPTEFDTPPTPIPTMLSTPALPESKANAELENTLRHEAYHWPRLVFPPLKKSGHIILDSCTPEGKIMRMTVPRSQGKQPYYDARKSSWGDLFPHPPKNPPQERIVVRDVQGKVKKVERGHIGKSQNKKSHDSEMISERLASAIREAKKANRRWERQVKAESIWSKE